jgi:general secretion pathway protein J
MNAYRASGRRLRLGGFTLLEILVVMSLLSVVMLALGSALRTIGQADERIDQRLRRADEMRVAVAFMRSTLERVSARRVMFPPPAKPGVLFAAGTDSVAWIGIDSALVIRFAPWVDTPAFPDWSRAESRVLVHHVSSIAMRFQDGQSNPPQWFTDWGVNDRLPDRLQLELQTSSGPWPPMSFPMRPMPAGDPGLGGAVFGAS